MPLQIFSEPESVSERLRQLGLDEGALRQARQQGLLASLECTPNHAPTAAGTYSYHEIVRSLRDLFRPFGWSSDDRRNRGLLTNEEGTRAIAVASGDKNTGLPDATPSTRNPKGITTVQNMDALDVQGFKHAEISLRAISANFLQWPSVSRSVAGTNHTRHD